MLPAWAVVQQPGSADADFATVPTSGTLSLGTATYTNSTIGTNAADIANVTTPTFLPGASVAFAAKASAPITLGSTLTLGNGINPSGLILDSGSAVDGGTLAFGAAEGLVYASGATSIGSALNPTTITGAGGVTFFGPGTVTLNGTNTYTAATNLAGPGGVQINSSAALGAAANAVNFNGGSLVLDTTAGGVTLVRNGNLNGNGTINVNSVNNAATFGRGHLRGRHRVHQDGLGHPSP